MVRARVKHLYATFEHLIHEIAKFGVVGAAAFVLTTVLNNSFRFGLKLGPLTSFGLATIIAATASYFANRHWTWRHKTDNGVTRGLSMFLVLSAVGLGISEVPVGVSEYVLGYHSPLAYNISSTLVGTALGTIWRFWSFRRWVFVDPEPADLDRRDPVPAG
ncbi:MAG TPA: GtrA family protein [Mycobacteriales bacterium]|nr:GtrA family protein [Mycobacteriales bacterium]